MFKVFINGEKHIVSTPFKRIQVDNDKPFKIRMRYIRGGSPEYTFEPKDNMALQILLNQKMLKWSGILIIIASAIPFLQVFFNTWIGKNLVLAVWFLLIIVPIFVRRKRGYIIKEVNLNDI
jgi:hypothetical protein